MNPIERYDPKGNFPVPLGSALRNPHYSYPYFDIMGDEETLRIYSDIAYHKEWEEGTPKQQDYVEYAAETAKLGNCSDMLRKLQAKTIFYLLNLPHLKNLKRINYTEPGAGKSTVVLYEFLNEKGYDIERLKSTLVEPSETRLFAAVEKLKDMDLKEGNHFNALVGKDSELGAYLKPGSQHIIANNATLHHHAYQDRVFELIFKLLADKGFFGNFDWYECLCEHPKRVYQSLKNHKFNPSVKWETKEKDLKRYEKMFPRALDKDYPRFTVADEMAATMITSFWLDGWAVARAKAIEKGEFDPRDDYFLHEAHGRPGPQVRLLINKRFTLNSPEIGEVKEAAEYNGNPHQILTKKEMLKLRMNELYDDIPEEGSNLLMGTLAQKIVLNNLLSKLKIK